jgi:hypothetical protein
MGATCVVRSFGPVKARPFAGGEIASCLTSVVGIDPDRIIASSDELALNWKGLNVRPWQSPRQSLEGCRPL